MFETRFSEVVKRPTECPFCKGKSIDTLAKVITVSTFWRCKNCDGTWTISSRAAASARPW